MKHSIITIPAILLAFAACSDDSSSSGTDAETLEDQNFTNEEGSSAVAYTGSGIFYTDKASFDIDTTKNTISIYMPECKVQGDTLYWSDGKDGKATKLSYKYNSSSKSINVEVGKENLSMKFYGDTFPYGQWIEPNAESGLVYNGYSLHTSSTFNYTKYFGDSCLVDHLQTVQGFLGFTDMKKMEKVDCNTTKYGDIDVVYEEYSAGKAEVTVSNGDESCTVTVAPRFKASEKECHAAYEDYKDSEDTKPFNFDDYDLDISGDVSCFKDMIK